MSVLAPQRPPRTATPTRSGTARGAAATTGVLLGGLVLGLGAGLGVRYLQKTGWTATTVLGFALLACGLVLTGLAVRLLWPCLPGWRRVALAPLALSSLVLLYAGALGVTATVVPPIALGSDTPAAHGFAARQVTVPTADGVALSGWWVPPRNGAALVLLHGAGEARTATLPQAQVLARHGYGVLLLDARGHGRSGGRGMDLGWYGDRDVAAGADFLTRQGVARVGLLGLSMGGEEAIGAAAIDPRLKVVVAEGATHRTAADKAAWLPGGLAGALQRGVDAVAFGFVDLLTPASPPTGLRTAVRRSAQTRYLLIAAGTVPDEQRAADVLRAQAPGRVTVWTAAGASHTHALQRSPREWERRVVGFLDRSLLAAGRPTR